MYKVALKNLTVKKSRTALAMTGLIIAVVGIISLISISDGIRYEVTKTVSMLEGVMVMQKGVLDDTASYLPLSYKSKFENINEVSVVLPSVSGIAVDFEKGGAELKAEILGGMVGLFGIDASEASKLREGTLYNPKIIQGRFLKASDKYSVIMGESLAEDYKKTVGSKVHFNGKDFKVVGIFESDSAAYERMIMLPVDIAQDLTGRDPDTIGFFYIELKNAKDAEKVASKINFRYEDEDIKATSASGFAGQIEVMLGSIDAFMIGISSIALMVGVVGILNTMLMSVKERTREFGILKAVGWTSEDVIKLILYESIFLGLLGGIVGIIISIGLVSLASAVLAFPLKITLGTIIYAFVVSVLAGIIGGVYPAWRTSKLDPVAAIRYE